MTPIKQGDTVEHVNTMKRATVIAIDVLWLRLETGRGLMTDLARYWRTVQCPK